MLSVMVEKVSPNQPGRLAVGLRRNQQRVLLHVEALLRSRTRLERATRHLVAPVAPPHHSQLFRLFRLGRRDC